MRDYDELIKALRMCDGDVGACRRCPRYGTDDCHSVFGEAADAIEELLAAVPKWISVEEQPIPYDWVWGVYRQTVCGKVMQHHKTVRMHGDNIIDQDGNIYNGFITHWMPRFPLPDPPKEVE